jgi:hypothetical protein
MKKRTNKSSSASHKELFAASHLTDASLLQFIDGELSVKDTTAALNHIQACWSCRSRKQALERGIAEFVAYQDSLVAPFLPPPPGPRGMFLARLDQAAAEIEQPPLFWRWFGAALAALRANQFANVIGALTVITIFFSWYLLRTVPTVSAREVLNRTAASEVSELRGLQEPVVVQKLRITSGAKSITRTVYQDIARNRSAARTEGQSEEAIFKAAYVRSSLAWDSTLDANTYRRWRTKQPSGTEHVSYVDRDHLKVATIFNSGPLKEADLTIRIPEYHATVEDLRFQDDTHVEIAEVSRNVVPFTTLAKNIFEDGVLSAEVSKPLLEIVKSVAPASLEEAPSDAELAKVQLEAERQLHALGADLGEQISITTEGGHDVAIEGVVRDTERKDQLISGLQSFSYLRIKLSTVEEAAAQSAPTAIAAPAERIENAPTVMTVAPPLLDEQLNARFPDKKQRIAYVNQTLSITQLASSRAWALKRLADRHPAQQIALLGASSKDDLKILLADHTSALREDASILDRQLRELMDSVGGNLATKNSMSASPMPVHTEHPDDWRDQVRRIHSLTETVHEAVAALITNSQPEDHAGAAEVQANLRTALAQLQIELKALDENLGNNF